MQTQVLAQSTPEVLLCLGEEEKGPQMLKVLAVPNFSLFSFLYVPGLSKSLRL